MISQSFFSSEFLFYAIKAPITLYGVGSNVDKRRQRLSHRGYGMFFNCTVIRAELNSLISAVFCFLQVEILAVQIAVEPIADVSCRYKKKVFECRVEQRPMAGPMIKPRQSCANHSKILARPLVLMSAIAAAVVIEAGARKTHKDTTTLLVTVYP
jgi:hypothetical protein